MTTIRPERLTDVAARERVLDAAYGAQRFTKPSAKIREGRIPAEGLALVAIQRGQVVGTVRLWHVSAGPDRPALLLGPLAVAPEAQGRGIGGALVRRALRDARRRGHRAVLLVGDAAYYGRFGFSAQATSGLRMPGPHDPERLLAVELVPGALTGARGLVTARGRPIRTAVPVLAAASVETPRVVPRAA